MTSFRNRILSLAVNRQSASFQLHFEDAASICTTKEAAMAFGYLLGREDAEKEVPLPDPPIYEQVVSVIEQCNDGKFDLGYASDLVFGLIYKWLDKMYEDEGYDCHAEDEFACRWYLANAFQPFVKPGVISPPLPEKEEQ